jgi:hypothetical protein
MTPISPPPDDVAELDLLRRLDAYARGDASWLARPLSPGEREACRQLYADLLRLVRHCFAPMLDRVTAREMEGFTAHDRRHALKVSHLMWHLTRPERRTGLTPAEIALLVLSAHLHDLGMGLSQEERAERLAPGSEFWEKADLTDRHRAAWDALRAAIADPALAEPQRQAAARRLHSAEEAMLCLDSRERHATRERYAELLKALDDMAARSRGALPSLDALLRFDGDALRRDLVEICVSHGEDAAALMDRDPENPDGDRFPSDAAFGCCTADIHFVAAALRLADLCDFDRERTPEVLFHYLIPSGADPARDMSAREWGKHMAISHWGIENGETLIYRGNCRDPVIHHAVVLFTQEIEGEIRRTRGVLAERADDWPFLLAGPVRAEIRPEGYRYLPFQFRLDEGSVFELLMGSRIYDTPLAAVRELIQNAVDACRLRDALTREQDPATTPRSDERIVVTYDENGAGPGQPTLSVRDSGIGMDRRMIEEYLLRIGRSYYRSAEFTRLNARLRRASLSFEPISEFGIGFLSSFMLADRLRVVTSRWGRPDEPQRVLEVDGVGRLIQVRERRAAPLPGGTEVILQLSRHGVTASPPTWEVIWSYVRKICVRLPYVLTLCRARPEGGASVETVEALALHFEPPERIRGADVTVDIDIPGVQGRIMTVDETRVREMSQADHYQHHDKSGREEFNFVSKGGFRIEREGRDQPNVLYRLQLTDTAGRYGRPRLDVSRTRLRDGDDLWRVVEDAWIRGLLARARDLPPLRVELFSEEKYSNSRGRYDSRFSEIAIGANANGLDLYHLGRATYLGTLASNPDLLVLWEQGEADFLPDTDHGFDAAFRCVLRGLVDRVVRWGGNEYILGYGALPSGWREKLDAQYKVGFDENAWRFADFKCDPPDVGLLFVTRDLDNPINRLYAHSLLSIDAPWRDIRTVLELCRRAAEGSYLPGLPDSELAAKIKNAVPDFKFGKDSRSRVVETVTLAEILRPLLSE